MTRAFATACFLALLIAPLSTHAATFTDDFEGGANQAGWSFIASSDILESTGGNPGWWLHQPTYDTFAPILDSAVGNGTPFVGNYAATMVSQIDLDARTDNVDFGDGSGFALTLVLRDMNGTPGDINDDDLAYFVGPNVPLEGAGWTHYTYIVPSQAVTLPAGWKGSWVGDCENFRPGVTWVDVMTSVDRVEFWWIDPCFAAIFQQWDVGVDNLSITTLDPTSVSENSWGGVKSLYR